MIQHSSILESQIENNTLVFELTTPMASDLPVYIAGAFNNWNPADEAFRFQQVGEQTYHLQLTMPLAMQQGFEYKYTRGSIDTFEIDEYGNEAHNRTFHTQQKLVQDYVSNWKRQGLNFNPALLPEKVLISEDFEIPQLIKTRRVAALLPYNYHETDRRYPVLYLQDGQNLFDDHAPFGSWSVDKKLATLMERGKGDIIIIAIDHAAEDRITEYTPSLQTRLGKGDGKKYVRFLADTLKHTVDKIFRTLPEREHTGMGGSSMGGLISIYAGLMYPEEYGRLMVFSPSLWVAPNIHFNMVQFDEPFNSKVYLYGGGEEGSYMVPNMKRFIEALKKQGTGVDTEFHLSVDPHGKHNEVRWGEEFPKAVEWLFFNHESQTTQPI